MKTYSTAQALLVMIAAAIILWPHSTKAQTNAAPQRIGVYDSRAIAYAHFWSEAHQQKINRLTQAAKEAKAAGQTDRFKELDAALKEEGERNHLRVFSTAPVDEILAGMTQQVAQIQSEAGVAQLVSKWDKETLKQHSRASHVDVTDRLLREFKLTDKQRQVVADLRKKQPLPLDKAQKLARQGKL